jgi:flagellar hook-length control protein FliK
LELSTTVGAEVAALLSPDSAGACLRRACAAAADPASPDDAVAPFADVLLDAEAACLATPFLPPGGNMLPPPAAAVVAASESASLTSTLPFATDSSGSPVANASRDALPLPAQPAALADPLAPTELPVAEPPLDAPDTLLAATAHGGVRPVPAAVSPATPSSNPAVTDDPPGSATVLPQPAVALAVDAADADAGIDVDRDRRPTPIRLDARRTDSSADLARPGSPSTEPPIRHDTALQPPPTPLPDRPLAETVARSSDAPVTALPAAPAMPEHAAVQRANPSAMPVDVDVDGGGRQPLPDALADRVQWMVDQHLGSAKLKLNPPHLGALDVSIRVGDDGTYVHFTSPHAGARDALEAALPRLRELLGAAGLELSGASVGGERASRDRPPAPAVSHAEPVERASAELPVFAATPSRRQIDLYA